MEILHIIAGPLIGAVIGYCTNWLAVKMLFKPLEPVKVFGKTLPLTPGVIPKNRDRIARACGKAVGETLLTGEDLKKAFLNDSAKASIGQLFYDKLSGDDFGEMTVNQIGENAAGREKTDDIKQTAALYLTDRIVNALSEFDFAEAITKVGGNFVREKLNNPMISMMLNDNVIATFASPAADSIKEFIADEGREKIREITAKEVEKLCSTKVGEIINPEANEETIKAVTENLYEKAVEGIIPFILQEINIAEIVENKICEMDMKFLEELILSIMKTELDYVVRLGALIGFVIGAVNILL
ncbi:MAG: DUF445 family protein [Firmicutes bacterium]|nr:DUF445 family protein [Bacillota bacterium]